MKPYLLLLATCLSLCSVATAKPGNSVNYKKFGDHRFAKINDTLYVCIFEVSNEDYKFFMADLEPAEQNKCQPDTTAWRKRIPEENWVSLPHNYRFHPAFDEFPIVSIPYVGAVRYCEWLTSIYNKRNKIKWLFRLPSEQEWKTASAYNTDTKLPRSLLNGKDAAGRYLENIKTVSHDSTTYSEDGGYYMVRVKAYWPNDYGIYNIIGNVAEMTNIDGLQKGGDYWTELKDVGIDKQQHYLTPDPRVGFRVFIQVLPTKK